jgi:hypothetical protein
MDMEQMVREAIVNELNRQAEEAGEGLRVDAGEAGRVRVDGSVDLEALSMAVVGAVAGGP